MVGRRLVSQSSVADLEEGELLELPERDAVIIKTDSQYESEYKSLEELGKGKFGVVNKCRRKANGEILAAKFVRKTAASKKEVTREIEMMNLLHHKRLIQLYDAFETAKDMIVVMELVTGGELFEKVVEEDNLTEKQVIRYIKQVLYGVQHMHRRHMVHLDLKPENILCLGGGKPGYEEIKLIDFGMTRVLKEGQNESTMCGTPEFVAPEVITFNPITVAADMWSIGVITYVLLSGLSPFMGDDDSETLKNVTSGEYDFEDDDEIFEHLSDEVKKFIEDLLILEPKRRLTVDDSLQHIWLTKGGSEKKINTANLKKFIARRRWQRTMNTIKAVSRLAGGLSLFGKKSGAHGLGKGGFLEKVKMQQSLEEKKEKEEQVKQKASDLQENDQEKKSKRDEEVKQQEEEMKTTEEGKRKKDQLEKENAEMEREEEEQRKKEEKRKREQEMEKSKKEEAAVERERIRKEEIERRENEREEREKERKKKLEEERQKRKEAEDERKQKREEERKRRQEERKRKEDERKEKQEESKVKGSTDESRNFSHKENGETDLIISNDDNNNNNNNNNNNDNDNNKNNKNEGINIKRTEKVFVNGVANEAISKLGTRSPKSSPSFDRGGAPKVGSVSNRIAAFQTGDIYRKNKK